ILIILIKKKSFASSLPHPGDLRPISICNSSMRIINFALTNRLLPIANRIISPPQQALPDRSIHRNIHTARMISEYLSKATPSESNLLLIDIAKAFDKLSHRYLFLLIQHLKFPRSITSLIITMHHSKARLLQNNLILDTAISTNTGVRQGFPISPVVFNLAIEPFIHKLQSTLIGITMFFDHNPSTHFITAKVLAYADDIITFNHN
ncbi:hypothetical protein CANARDRAFT_187873, partial [[Candida] arabinofermentans NRRL YB-2248]